jgi:hypothetical protein
MQEKPTTPGDWVRWIIAESQYGGILSRLRDGEIDSPADGEMVEACIQALMDEVYRANGYAVVKVSLKCTPDS